MSRSNCEPARILLYVGAYIDAFPLTVPAFRTEHTHFIYVDKQPKHDDAMAVRTEEQLLASLLSNAGGGAPERFDDHWRCQLRNGATLLYYFNVLDREMAAHPTLAKWLPSVRTLFAAGYTPCVLPLPSLETVVCTYMCKYNRFGELETCFAALPSTVRWVPMTQTELVNGRWEHVCWRERDRARYPISDLPSYNFMKHTEWVDEEEDEDEEDEEDEEEDEEAC